MGIPADCPVPWWTSPSGNDPGFTAETTQAGTTARGTSIRVGCFPAEPRSNTLARRAVERNTCRLREPVIEVEQASNKRWR